MVGTTDVTMDVAFTVDWRPPSIDVGETAYLCDGRWILPEMNVCEGCCLEPFQRAAALRRRCEQPSAAQRGILSSNRMPRRTKRP